MERLCDEEIMYMKECLEFGYLDNAISDSISSTDFKTILRDYAFTTTVICGFEYFKGTLDSFQRAAVFFESIKNTLKDKKNFDQDQVKMIAASATLLFLSNRNICSYQGIFHDQLTYESEKIDIYKFRDDCPSAYQKIKESFKTLKEEDPNYIWKNIYGYSLFLEQKCHDIFKQKDSKEKNSRLNSKIKENTKA